MTRSKIIVVLLFVVAFGAGLMTGRVFQHHPNPPQERGPSWLSQELNLTEPQREEMLAIWGSLYKNGSSERSQRRELQKWRNEAVAKLIPEAKQAELDKISQDYTQKLDALMTEGRERYQQAVEQTKVILTPEQREKYEELLARRDQQRRRGGPDRGGREGERSTNSRFQGPSPDAGDNAPAGPALKDKAAEPAAKDAQPIVTPQAETE